ncbi:hypothetical protein Pcac1_g18054 [Phytophthora cactorum]|nr:hypothetical protein Pcac1_g18054 [Phytophthora cactorum]
MSAVTCHFERRTCRHSTLFMVEYKRTNRTKKTKILRCFPHCCPEHLNRSYCGSSLCVRVKLVDPARLDAQQQIETTTVSTTNPASLLISIQTEQTPKGTWIEGSVVRDADADHSSLFQINPGARWYYEWESAATKAQRFTKHALRVYIFQRPVAVACGSLISSSEFMVVSYRRAPGEVRAEREALEASRTAVGVQQLIPPVADGYSSSRVTTASFERKPPPSPLRQIAGREEMLWQKPQVVGMSTPRHHDVVEAARHPLLLPASFERIVTRGQLGSSEWTFQRPRGRLSLINRQGMGGRQQR